MPYLKGNPNTKNNNREDLTILTKTKKRRPRDKPTEIYNETRRPDKFGTQTRLQSYSYINKLLKLQRINYYHALLHPYAVCVERAPVCLPMEIPLPTVTTYHIKRLDINADASGSLKLRFSIPKVQGITTAVPGIVYSCTGPTTIDTNWTTVMTAPLMTNTIKTRNVGAEFKLTFVGKVINTSGVIDSMASYSAGKMRYNTAAVPYACTTGQFTSNPDIDSYAHQMPWFERQPLQPGLVTRCIWVPVDYSDRDFHTGYSYAADIVRDEYASDMEWFVVVKGAEPGAPFVLEYAGIVEQQLSSVVDIYARNSTLLSASDISDKEVIEEGIKNRSSNYHKEGTITSALKNLAVKGADYLKKHSADIATWGLKALSALLV